MCRSGSEWDIWTKINKFFHIFYEWTRICNVRNFKYFECFKVDVETETYRLKQVSKIVKAKGNILIFCRRKTAWFRGALRWAVKTCLTGQWRRLSRSSRGRRTSTSTVIMATITKPPTRPTQSAVAALACHPKVPQPRGKFQWTKWIITKFSRFCCYYFVWTLGHLQFIYYFHL